MNVPEMIADFAYKCSARHSRMQLDAFLPEPRLRNSGGVDYPGSA